MERGWELSEGGAEHLDMPVEATIAQVRVLEVSRDRAAQPLGKGGIRCTS